MKKSFFQNLLEYHHQTNQNLIDQLLIHQSEISERSIPLLSHQLNAHQIWNARILNETCFGVDDVHSLTTCKIIDQTNFESSLKIIDSLDLDLEILYVNSLGIKYQNSIKDILFHVTNHHTHHRGQIISDLRLQGIAPILTDYIFYARG